MTELVLRLPDGRAQRARSAGLLTDSAIQRLLEEAMRRDAGRRLLQVAGIAPMSDDEVIAEVEASRAERRGGRADSARGNDSDAP